MTDELTEVVVVRSEIEEFNLKSSRLKISEIQMLSLVSRHLYVIFA